MGGICTEEAYSLLPPKSHHLVPHVEPRYLSPASTLNTSSSGGMYFSAYSTGLMLTCRNTQHGVNRVQGCQQPIEYSVYKAHVLSSCSYYSPLHMAAQLNFIPHVCAAGWLSEYTSYQSNSVMKVGRLGPYSHSYAN